MRFPVLREQVRLQGRSGTFIVVALNRDRGLADVLSNTRGSRVEQNIPLSSILPLDGPKPPKDRDHDSDPPF